MEERNVVKIISHWIVGSNDYSEIKRLRKEIAQTIEDTVNQMISGDIRKLIEAAERKTSSCILEQDDLDLSFLRSLMRELCPELSNVNFSRLLPIYTSEYNDVYGQVYDSTIATEIRNLRIPVKNSPRLFSVNVDSFKKLKDINENSYNKLSSLLIEYFKVCKGLDDKVRLLFRILTNKRMDRAKLKSEFPDLYKLC